MADKEVRIKFVTNADLSAAKRAELAIKRQEEIVKIVDEIYMKRAKERAKVELGLTEKISERTVATKTAAEATKADGQELEKSTKTAERAAKAQENLTRATETTTKGKRNMGMAALEASRAFEDLQYGIGGVLNNIPGLIAMLGGGAGLAGGISIAAVAATQLWKRMSNGSKEASKDLEEFAEKLAELQKQRNQAIAERAAQETLKWIESLDDEETAIARVNKQLQLNIDLQRAKQIAQAELEDDRFALELAQINADPTTSDIEKIRLRSDVINRQESSRLDRRMRDIDSNLYPVESEARFKTEAAERAEADAAEIQARLVRATEEFEALQKRIRNAQQATEASKTVADLLAKAEDFAQSPNALIDPEVLKAARAEVERLKTQLAGVTARANSVGREDRDRLAWLANEKGLASAALPSAQSNAERMRNDANIASDIAAARRQQAEQEKEFLRERFPLRQKARIITEDASIRSLEEREEERRRKEEEEAEKKAAREKAEELERRLQDQAVATGQRFDRAAEAGREAGVDTKDVRAIRSIGNSLADGTTVNEIIRLQRQLTEVQRTNNSAILASMSAQLEQLKTLGREVDELKRRMTRR